MLQNINEACDVQLKGHIDGLASFKVDIKGADYAKIFIFIFNMFTF